MSRVVATLYGVDMAPSRYYTFMASVKLRWESVWAVLWRAIPDPLTDGRLLVALDDSINPKTGRKVFGCQPTCDHAAKTNQSSYPWAQTIVTVGLLKVIHGRWACLPLAFAFYLRRQTLRAGCLRVRGQAIVFQSKFAQAVRLLAALAGVFGQAPILVVADSWFGNQGLLKPLRAALGPRAHLLSRLRVNAVLYERPTPTPGAASRCATRAGSEGAVLGRPHPAPAGCGRYGAGVSGAPLRGLVMRWFRKRLNSSAREPRRSLP